MHVTTAASIRRFRLQPWHLLPWLAAVLFLWQAPVAQAQSPAPSQAMAEADPPGRVAHVSQRQGSVVFAPEGEEEWVDLPQNRPLTAGDRLWSDRGARAELQLGAATLHLDGESHLGISTLDDQAAQFIVMQGSVQARVREVGDEENFEIDTPNLALRALQPGEFRVDVSADGKTTRVVVLSGSATVYGEGGQAVNLGAGQQASFAGRSLAQVNGSAWQMDALAQWAAERNRAEDQSIAARHVPRGVVGYAQLDQHGTWSQDPQLGSVWYPQVPSADWAPYRDGRWEWVQPWGWTWVDAAPWGFAPFHYGRWTQIGPRWAWVPGRLAARPVYSPALVVFMGGGVVADGPGVGWYPLAPGEAWYPTYRASPRYLNYVNFHIDLNRHRRGDANHWFRHRPYAVTAVRVDDFRGGRSVRDAWRPAASWGSPTRLGWVPPRPDRRMERPFAGVRLQSAPATVPQPNWRGREWNGGVRFEPPRVREAARFEPPRVREAPRFEQRPEWRGERREERRDDHRRAWRQEAPSVRALPQPPVPAANASWERDRAVREQHRAQREQQRLQHEAQREQRRQQFEAQRGAREPQWRQQRNEAPQQQAFPVGRPGMRGDDDRGGRGEGRGHRGPRGGDDDGPGRGRHGGWQRNG